jgi:uncharacterized protein (DUF2141 family)
MSIRSCFSAATMLSILGASVLPAQSSGATTLASVSRASVAPSALPETFTLTVVVTGASQDGGRIGAALFASADGFLKDDQAAQRFVRERTAPVDSFVFRGLAPGHYAIAAFHDVNSNGKIDKNLFGAPKESWGTSGDVRPKLRAPRFDEARVEVAGDVRVEIVVKR